MCSRDDHEAVLSLAFLPHNGSTMTTNITTQLSNTFPGGNVTLGGSYEGCLDQLIINQHKISLLDPLDVSAEIATCGPRPPSETVRGFGYGVWLFGAQSYVRLTLGQIPPSQFQIQLQFRTLDAHGLLLFYPSNDLTQYLVLYLLDGRVMVDYRLTTLDLLSPLQSVELYNTGLWCNVVLSVDGPNVTVIINDTETLGGSSSAIIESGARFSPSDTLLLGGLSSEYANVEDSLATSSSIAGCVRNLRIGVSMLNLQDSENLRADVGGCPEVVAPGVRFMGNGNAEFGFTSQQFHNITFAFRTTQLTALLLEMGGLSVRIFHAKIRVDIGNHFILISEESGLNDNTRHSVLLLYSLSKYELQYYVAA